MSVKQIRIRNETFQTVTGIFPFNGSQYFLFINKLYIRLLKTVKSNRRLRIYNIISAVSNEMI